MSRKPLTNKEGEVRPLTAEDMAQFRPAREVIPDIVDAMIALQKQRGRPRLEKPKVNQTFRFDPELVQAIKAQGPGYNAVVEGILRKALLDAR